MAKLLLIDPEGVYLFYALRCISSGHEVKYFIPPFKGVEQPIGRGLISRVDDWKPWVKWADIIVNTHNIKYMQQMLKYQEQGYPIFGPTAKSAKLELDRMYGQKVIKDFGGKIIPSTMFNNYDKAIDFVKKNPIRWVSKPCGEEEDKSLSYVSKNAEDMIFQLTKWKKKKQSTFILQEFKPGIEFSVSGIFGPGGFSKYWTENFEFKKHMAGDIGVNTGEQGTVMLYTENSKLADQLLRPLEPVLHKLKFTGLIDINCIIDEKDGTPWPMEWTARLGWPSWAIQCAMTKGDPLQWMIDCLNGQDTVKVDAEKPYIGLVLSNGDYPFDTRKLTDNSDYPFVMTNKDYIKDINPIYLKLGTAPKKIGNKIVDEVPEMVTCGVYLAVCTGSGTTVKQAKNKAYDVLKSINVGNSPQYRIDIGDRLEKQLPKLKKFGYAKSFKFD